MVADTLIRSPAPNRLRTSGMIVDFPTPEGPETTINRPVAFVLSAEFPIAARASSRHSMFCTISRIRSIDVLMSTT